MTLGKTGAAQLRAFLQEARSDPRRTLVALDVDGTVSAIAPSPDEARVEREMQKTLELVGRRMELWFISGRDIDVLRRLVGIDTAGYIGAHGLEVLDQGGLRPMLPMGQFRRQLSRVAQEVSTDVPEAVPYIERKRWGVTFHYRALPEDSDVPERLRRSLEARLTPELRVQAGKQALELVPAVDHDKGTALGWLIESKGPRRALAAGDDLTDVAMFRSLAAQREAGGIDGLCVAVLHGDETPREVVEAADATVEGVTGLQAVLTRLLRP